MTQTEEMPVRRTDLIVLVVASAVGGFLLASWLLSPQPSPQFASAVLASASMIAFFLFVPVMGARLFVDDWRGTDD